MISALCPSRGRPEMLARSVSSLRGTATGPVEVMVAADDDDPATAATALGLDARLRTSPRKGFARLHEYYNDLAFTSLGDWLLIWSDDAVMLTPGWDEMIESLPGHILVADLQSAHSPLLVCFPAVRRSAVTALGRFSTASPHCDTFWGEVGRWTGTIAAVAAHVHHDRPDLTGRPTDLTHDEGRSGYGPAWFHGAEHMAELAVCAETVAAAHREDGGTA